MEPAELYDGSTRIALRLSRDEGNWLMVELDARVGPRVWKEVDSCLRRSEVEETIAWFEQPTTELSFQEGDLAFALGEDQLVVLLDLEFLPPDWDDESAFEVSIRRDDQQMKQFSAALRAQLESIDRGDVVPRSPLEMPSPLR